MFSSQPGSLNLNEYVFIDFAGSGLVHLCGEFMYIHRLHTQALRPAFEPLLEFKLFSPLLHFLLIGMIECVGIVPYNCKTISVERCGVLKNSPLLYINFIHFQTHS